MTHFFGIRPISDVMRITASKIQEAWEEKAAAAWLEVPAEERKILEKYVTMFLRKLKDEDFPKEDKEILRRHAKAFQKFLRSMA